MNISYDWLKELIDIDLPAAELAEKLTRVGLAVDGVHPHGDDFVLDIDLTSNRPDCLSHLGVAREIGVITGKALTTETQRHREEIETAPYPNILASGIVKIENPEFCYRFTARIIRNVKISESPKWLVDRLEAIGERSINNVADITNYLMHELGQPMHSFDLDKLAGNRIVVRTARPGETLKTLDEIERKLDASMLAICDVEKPVAVAGVMGGFDSGITEGTTNVLLEVAYFKRESVRQTSRKLNLTTEASYRFERGVDIMNLKRASDRATELIVLLTGGEAGEFIDVFPTPIRPKEVESKDISAAVKRLTGLEVEEAESVRILNALGIATERESEISDSGSKIFISPSWRHDIAIEEDLVEEVARHVGYDKITDELPPAYGAGEYQATEPQELAIRHALVDAGFDEALNYSFIDTKHDEIYETIPGLLDESLENKFVEIRDAVIEGGVRMRPTLLPGLLDSIRLNFNQQNKNLKVFELGKAFGAAASEEDLPNERELLALAVTGHEINRNRAMPGRELDFYDTKGAVESALDAAGYQNITLSASEVKHLRPGQSASISVSGIPVGTIGRLNEEISANYKFRQPVYVAEIDLQAVLAEPPAPVRYAPLSKYPSVVRDVSFTVSREISYDSIKSAVKEQGVELCRRISFVDVYEGKGLASSERSLTIRLEYRSDERTLIEDDVEQIHARLVRTLEEKLGIKQRI
ncbi:MAG TPA: phenylalanine--tRNA ligase subunit beta [Pyrinomonadaceae bacterium]|nr:phenylalanine--tRNA ligase subunit beta [Pyrinomonadaceae bacterium]